MSRLEREADSVWACRKFNLFGKLEEMLTCIRLAYCEIYVALGTLFRRFENLKCNKLSPHDLAYLDFLASAPLDDAAVLKVFEE